MDTCVSQQQNKMASMVAVTHACWVNVCSPAAVLSETKWRICRRAGQVWCGSLTHALFFCTIYSISSAPSVRASFFFSFLFIAAVCPQAEFHMLTSQCRGWWRQNVLKTPSDQIPFTLHANTPPPPQHFVSIQDVKQNNDFFYTQDGLAHFHVAQLIKLVLGQSVTMTENRL